MADQTGSAIGVGMLGMGSMGRAHSSAFRRIAQVRPGAEPRLMALACRSAETGQAFAARFGFAAWQERWEDLIADPRLTLFDNTGPNGVHAEPCIAAARAGKHVLCGKMIRFGVIGTNLITDIFIQDASALKEFSLTAVYSRTEKKAIEFARKYNIQNIFVD